MNCKTCDKSFHACGSCAMDNEWEWDYCSAKCWYESERSFKNRMYLSILLSELEDPEHKKLLRTLIEDVTDYRWEWDSQFAKVWAHYGL